MPETGRTPDSRPNAEVGKRLQALESEVGALRTELAGLRALLATEIRTQRLVIVEEDGFERVVLGGADRYGFVTVRGRNITGALTSVEVFANDPIDGDGAHVGLALTDCGDVGGAFELVEGRHPRLWTDPGASDQA